MITKPDNITARMDDLLVKPHLIDDTYTTTSGMIEKSLVFKADDSALSALGSPSTNIDGSLAIATCVVTDDVIGLKGINNGEYRPPDE